MNAYEKAEDEWALVELGNFLKGLGKSNESIAAYETAIRVDDGAIKRYPNYAEAWANKGAALTSLGNYAESIAAYGKALEIDRNYTYAWNEKGRAFAALGKYNESIEAYDRAIGINPEYEWAWANKGVALDNLGKYDEASKAFEEAKRLAPERFGGWNATEYGLQHSPDWMEVKTYSQGRGLHAYIILYNNAGLMIRANGVLRIEIFEGDSKLWSKSYTVKAEDFVDTAAGLGAFAHPVTLWDAGRISYDTIKPGLGDLTLEKSVYMEIRAYFETTNGRVLKDKTTSYVS
jgi:tetratricopeptide (TPR) repeat protein